MAKEADQLYYTSCRKGLSGYAGFQGRAVSHGMKPDERREIEGRGGYMPPRDLPREPSEDEIRDIFPRAFRSFGLGSGRQAIMLAAYAGKDYSNRWGNYFLHALVLDGPPAGRWSIDACSWNGWVTALAPGEDEREPQPLPAIDASGLFDGEDYSFSELSSFLNESPDRVEKLARMIQAVFARKDNPRNLVIRVSDDVSAVYWIACILKAFPSSCQSTLNWSTYQSDPRMSLVINATMGKTDFLLDERERKYQFYVFDLVDEKFSEIPAGFSEYAETIAGWMKNSPDTLVRFHGFVNLFERLSIGQDLQQLLSLFRLGGGIGPKLDRPGRLASLDFVREHAGPDAIAVVMNALWSQVQRPEAAASWPQWNDALSSWSDIVKAGGILEHEAILVREVVRAFDLLVVESGRHIPEVLGAINQLGTLSGRTDRMFAELFCVAEHTGWLLDRISRLSPEAVTALLTVYERTLQVSNRNLSPSDTFFRSLVKAAINANPGNPGRMDWALRPFASRLDDLFEVTVFIADLLNRNANGSPDLLAALPDTVGSLGHDLSSVLSGYDRSARFSLLRRLSEVSTCHQVLLGEWDASIRVSTDREGFWDSYVREMMSAPTAFADNMRRWLPLRLIKVLPPDEAAAILERFIQTNQFASMNNEIAGRMLVVMSGLVRLATTPRLNALAAAIRGEISRRHLRLSSNRLELAMALYSLKGGWRDLNVVAREVGQADRKTYEEYMSEIFPGLLARAKTAGEYAGVVRASYNPGHDDVFVDAFLKNLPLAVDDELPGSCVAGLVFWLAGPTGASAGLPRQAATAFKTSIRKRIESMTNANRRSSLALIRKERAFQTEPGRSELEGFLGSLGAEEQGFAKKVFGWFNSPDDSRGGKNGSRR